MNGSGLKQERRPELYFGTNGFIAGFQPSVIAQDILHELAKARRKFPDQHVWITLAALSEEVGELNQAILQFNHEPHKGKTEEDIYKEAVQVAVMAIRVALDCEHKN